MPVRPRHVALGAAVVILGISAVRALPASPEPDRLRPGAVADIVALLHHDQQGIVLAHQAQAQSPTETTRARAAVLAASFREQARALVAALDGHAVPVRQRLVDTTRLEVADRSAVGCDIMPKDSVSRLAATPPDVFDERFTTLMDRHLVGGARMIDTVVDRGVLDRGVLDRGVLDGGALGPAPRADLRPSRRTLS